LQYNDDGKGRINKCSNLQESPQSRSILLNHDCEIAKEKQKASSSCLIDYCPELLEKSPKVTLSWGLPALTPQPFFQWYLQSNEILFNPGMKF
jgi:hypothetical protein